MLDRRTLWFYAPGDSSRVLGRALALAVSRDATQLDLVVDDGGGVAARRAGGLSLPIDVWRVDGTSLVAAAPQPLPEPRLPPPEAAPFIDMLRDAAVDVIVEHGTVSGEVRGLEVARLTTGDNGQLNLDVGVGRFDQEASALLHGDEPPRDALARAAAELRRHRHPGAAPHPVGRLARERWLRAQVLDDPTVIGLSLLEPVEPSAPRRNLREPHPAAAFGCDDAGRRVLAVCSVGVDLELIPEAGDLVRREQAERVVLVTPARDQVAVQRSLAALLPVPTEFVAVEGEWSTRT